MDQSNFTMELNASVVRKWEAIIHPAAKEKSGFVWRHRKIYPMPLRNRVSYRFIYWVGPSMMIREVEPKR
jgi:hypothetical protein